MASILLYQAANHSFHGEETLAYATNSPAYLLEKLYQRYLVLEYSGIRNFMSSIQSGLIIRQADKSFPGTTITESIDNLSLESIIPNIALHQKPFTDEQLKLSLASYISHDLQPQFNRLHLHKNYLLNFDNEADRIQRPGFFKECDEKIKKILEITTATLRIDNLYDLRQMYLKATFPTAVNGRRS